MSTASAALTPRRRVMTIHERFERAVLQQIPDALLGIQASLHELGLPVELRSEAMVEAIRTHFNRLAELEEPDDADEPALLEFGSSPDTCPLALARSLVAGLLKTVLYGALTQIEDEADRRLRWWVKNTMSLGVEEFDIRWNELRLVPSEPLADLVLRLRRAFQIIQRDREDLEAYLREREGKTPDDDLEVFLRDLAHACLASEAIHSALRSIWHADSAGTVKEVMEALIEEADPHRRPLVYVKDLLTVLFDQPEAPRERALARITGAH